MSDIYERRDLKKESLFSVHRSEETVKSFDAQEMFRQSDMYMQSQQTMPTFLEDHTRQKVISKEQLKNAIYSEKLSRQESAEEHTPEDFFYTPGVAASAISQYNEEKKRMSLGEYEKKEYRLTGREFILPPIFSLGDEDEFLGGRIARVMLRRDELIRDIKAGGSRLSHEGLKKRASDQILLDYVNDIIDTFMKANGVSERADEAVDKKEQESAREHMKTALKEYETYVRSPDAGGSFDDEGVG